IATGGCYLIDWSVNRRGGTRRGEFDTIGAGERSCTGHDAGEGRDARNASHPTGHRFAEQERAGRDRHGVRPQGRHPRGGEGTAALEAELESDKCEAVTYKQGGDEGEASSSDDRRFRPHVTGRVEHARGDTEP